MICDEGQWDFIGDKPVEFKVLGTLELDELIAFLQEVQKHQRRMGIK